MKGLGTKMEQKKPNLTSYSSQYLSSPNRTALSMSTPVTGRSVRPVSGTRALLPSSSSSSSVSSMSTAAPNLALAGTHSSIVAQEAEEISFSNKKLIAEAVPRTLHGYPNLHTVDLSRNKINTVPKGIPSKVIALDLSHNLFTTITGMNRVSQLIEIRLTHNKLMSMEGIGAAIGLRHIDLSHNKISVVEGLEVLSDLQTLGSKFRMTSHALFTLHYYHPTRSRPHTQKKTLFTSHYHHPLPHPDPIRVKT